MIVFCCIHEDEAIELVPEPLPRLDGRLVVSRVLGRKL